jgi:hypothetical protein
MRKCAVPTLRVYLFLSITIWACTGVWANPEESQFFRVYFEDKKMAIDQLQQFEAEAYEVSWEGQYHVMKLTPEDVDVLESRSCAVEPYFDYDPHHNRVAESVRARYETIPGYPSYKIVESTYAIAESLVTAYPKLATFVDGGDSWEKTQGSGGYDLMVLVLTNSDFPGPKPKCFIGGSIHAREYTTSELDLRFVLYLIENYGKDADVTWMLNYHEFHAMFYINPDGRKHAEDGESWRKNTNTDYCEEQPRYRGVDLNRNADASWAGGSDECSLTYPGPSAASEPEMQGLQAYMDSIFEDNSVKGIYIDLHSYGEIIYLPSAMGRWVRKFSYFNGYDPQDVRPGLAYAYAYYNAGAAAACLFELGTSFFQSCDYFENTIVPDNIPAFIYALKSCRDPVELAEGPDAVDLAVNGKTLTAKIDDTRYGHTVPTQNIAEAEYYITDPPWAPGATAIPMSASDGSFNSKIEEVEATLPEDLPNNREEGIIFVRGKDADGNWGALSAIFSDQVNTIPHGVGYGTKVAFTYTNPLRTPATINLTLPKATDVQLRVYNVNGKVITTLADSKLKAGRHSIQWKGTDGLGNELAKGIYLFQLSTGSYKQTERFVFVR